MRLQKAPQEHARLVPRFMAVPPSLETYALQLIYPINIASSDQTKGVPEWVRSLVPVVEPRLDNSTGTATNWFLFTDPALIDTLEYCYLEGQQGVYIETGRASKWTASRSRRAWTSARRQSIIAVCKRARAHRKLSRKKRTDHAELCTSGEPSPSPRLHRHYRQGVLAGIFSASRSSARLRARRWRLSRGAFTTSRRMAALSIPATKSTGTTSTSWRLRLTRIAFHDSRNREIGVADLCQASGVNAPGGLTATLLFACD